MTQTEEHIRQIGEDEFASEAVLWAIAAVSNRPLLDFPPLQETIDTDSLDRLFASPTRIESLRFRYEGYEITVEPGRVRIREDR